MGEKKIHRTKFLRNNSNPIWTLETGSLFLVEYGKETVNPKKTKVMTFNCPSKIDIKTSDGSILEEVDDFTYLGSLVSSSRADIAKRIGLAWAAHNKMSRMLGKKGGCNPRPDYTGSSNNNNNPNRSPTPFKYTPRGGNYESPRSGNQSIQRSDIYNKPLQNYRSGANNSCGNRRTNAVETAGKIVFSIGKSHSKNQHVQSKKKAL